MNSNEPSQRLTDDELVTAFREAPVARRTASQVEDAAARFVKSTQERAVIRRTRKRLLPLIPIALILVVVAGAALFAVFARPQAGGTESVVLVDVQPSPGTVFERVDHGPVQAVRLHDGSVVISVKEATRFLVVTGDAQIESSGAALFEVIARADRITRVRDIDGAVTVRPLVGPVHAMTAGTSFDAPAALPDATGRAEARMRMNAGLELLASGKFAEAAAQLRAEAEAPGSPFIEEASFWQAVAVSRAGQRAEARAKLESFLARFPSSAHKLEALGVLGWELLDAGDVAGARRAFDDVKQSDDLRVRESAEAGLKQIASR